MATKLAFTKQRLEALEAPQNGRTYVYDEKTEGLSLCLTASGSKVYYVYRWHDGKPVRLRLGNFPAMTVELARKACQKAVASMASGIDPQAAKQAARHEQTVEGLFQFWLAEAKSRGVKTWEEEEKRYNRYLSTWGKRKLSSIKKSDVQSLFSHVTTNAGLYSANKLLALVKAMFHKAPDMGFTGTDPTAGVKKHREEKRDRFIRGDELGSFFKALFAEQNTTLRDLLLVALLTGARKNNVAAMRWEEIDFTTNLWRIPTTKSGKPVVVPLTPPAIAVLKTRHDANGTSPWVFPSNRSKTGRIVEVKSAWKRITTAAKLTDCRPHDLRRSLASYMAIAGTGLPVIGAMLGHSQPSTTAIYARLSTDPVRAAAETATNNILEAAGATIDCKGITLDVKAIEVEADHAHAD